MKSWQRKITHIQDLGRILSRSTNGTARLCEIACEGPKKEKSVLFYVFKWAEKFQLGGTEKKHR